MKTLLASTMIAAAALVAMPTITHADAAEIAYFKDVSVINLDAEARRVVTQDRVQVNLAIEAEGKTAAEVQNAINTKMTAALAKANAVQGVKVSTGYYNVYKTYEGEPPNQPKPLTAAEREKYAIWRGQQTLVLDGSDKDKVLKLSGDLQASNFAMQGMNFYLSREASDRIKDELIAEALNNVKARAQKVATQLALPKVHLARINIGSNGGYQPPMMMRAMAMKGAEAADMSAPVGQAGESEVTLNVSVEVHLSK
jgi:predicted secreted protein